MNIFKSINEPNVKAILDRYHNNGVVKHWYNVLGTTFKTNPILAFIHRVYQLTWLIMKDAGIELFFLLVFWLIITGMSQGRDLIVSLFEPDGIYSESRIFLTVLSGVSLSFSMWMIPAFLFQFRDNKNLHQVGKRSVFRKHLFFAHRVLSLVPLWLLAAAFFNQKGIGFLLAGISIAQVIFLNWFFDRIESRKIRILFGLGVVVLLAGATIHFGNIYKEAYTWAKLFLAAILYLVSLVLHVFYYEVDLEILNENMKTGRDGVNPFRRYLINSICYFIFLGVHVGFILLFFSSRRYNLAPESIMLYIFSLYVFIIDLIVYLINYTPRLRFRVLIGAVVLGVAYLLSPLFNVNVTHYELDGIKEKSVLEGKERLSFTKRYQVLKNQIDSNKTGKPYPIILISGEGGGSRAGLWFSQNLINFDYYTHGKFRDHIFSISTVSGSSVGLSTVFTYWEEATSVSDTNWLEFPLKVYGNNFVGSSVKGMLLTDLWKSLWPFCKFEEDRNSILQAEEAYYTQEAVFETKFGYKPSVKEVPDSSQVLRKDFMSFFYTPSGDSVLFKKRPLVFINSCRSNDGRRGIISPVKLNDDVFNDAVDVAGYLYEDSVCTHEKARLCSTYKKNISFGQACNLSELFPLFSAPAYIDSLGSFVDGGYHENSGLKTTLDVYLSLKKELANDTPKGEYEIYILYFKNGSGKKNLYKKMDSELPLALPVKALTNQPFEGSASYFEEKSKYIAGPADNTQFLAIQLDNKIIKDETAAAEKTKRKREIEDEILDDLRTEKDNNALSFPLARWLSKSVIKRIRLATFPIKEHPGPDDKRMVELLEKINMFYNVAPPSTKPFEKWSLNAKKFIPRQKVIRLRPDENNSLIK
jgi:hypothetical protein